VSFGVTLSLTVAKKRSSKDQAVQMTKIDVTLKERDLIRREFVRSFGSVRSIQDGILVRRWATGPHKGKPKPVAAVQSMLDRELLVMQDDGIYWLTARFTAKGIAALQSMASDRRSLPPGDYPELLQELEELSKS